MRSTSYLGYNVRCYNDLKGSDATRADLAARIIGADIAARRPGALVELSPRLFGNPFGGYCDHCSHLGPIEDEIQWSEWDGKVEIQRVHRSCLADAVTEAVAKAVDVVSVVFGLKRRIQPVEVDSPLDVAA